MFYEKKTVEILCYYLAEKEGLSICQKSDKLPLDGVTFSVRTFLP